MDSALPLRESSARQLPRRLREILRTEGWRGLIRRLMHRAFGPWLWLERIAFFDSDLRADARDAPPSDVAVRVREASPDELRTRFAAQLAQRFDIDRGDLERRLAHGQIAVVALNDGELVGMDWVAFDEQPVSEIGRRLVMRRGEFITYNEGTVPEWRGHNISPQMNICAERIARARGATRRVTWRRLANHAGLRVAAKMRDRRFATVTTVRLFGRDQALVFGLRAPELAPLIR